MRRMLFLTAAVIAGGLVCESTSQAQVYIRAPFVRVTVGGDGAVGVRAPFVDFYAPPGWPYAPPPPGYGPTYRPPHGPAVVTTPQTPQSSVAPVPLPKLQGEQPFT